MRHTTRDVPGWSRQVRALEAAPDDPLTQSRLADLLRFDPASVSRALELQRRALARARREGLARALPTIRLRLAVALQYANRHREALALMNAVARDLRRGRDFLYQLRGKCQAEMGRLREARADLRRALTLRLRRKTPDPALIASSRESLSALP